VDRARWRPARLTSLALPLGQLGLPRPRRRRGSTFASASKRFALGSSQRLSRRASSPAVRSPPALAVLGVLGGIDRWLREQGGDLLLQLALRSACGVAHRLCLEALRGLRPIEARGPIAPAGPLAELEDLANRAARAASGSAEGRWCRGPGADSPARRGRGFLVRRLLDLARGGFPVQ